MRLESGYHIALIAAKDFDRVLEWDHCCCNVHIIKSVPLISTSLLQLLSVCYMRRGFTFTMPRCSTTDSRLCAQSILYYHFIVTFDQQNQSFMASLQRALLLVNAALLRSFSFCLSVCLSVCDMHLSCALTEDFRLYRIYFHDVVGSDLVVKKNSANIFATVFCSLCVKGVWKNCDFDQYTVSPKKLRITLENTVQF